MSNFLLFSMPGGTEWILIFVIVLLMFGGRKIPELMKGLGKGIREFNDAREKVKSDIEAGMKESDKIEENQKETITKESITAKNR